jgi:hypothetical protein
LLSAALTLLLWHVLLTALTASLLSGCAAVLLLGLRS